MEGPRVVEGRAGLATESPPPKPRIPLLQLWPTLVLVCVGVLGSVLAALYAQDRDRVFAQARFEHQAINIAASVERNLIGNVEILLSLRHFFDASSGVDRESFRIFCAGPLGLYPGIQALEWVPRVLRTQRAMVEAAVRREGFPAFTFTERSPDGRLVPAGPRDEYFPIIYVEPLAGNEDALGHDPLLFPRLDAIRKARDTGEAIATARFTLIQDRENQAGIALFLPIYAGGGVPPSLQARRERLLGFAEGVFRVGDMVTASLKDLDLKGIGLQISDHTDPGKPDLLFASAKPAPASADSGATVRWTRAIDFGGRDWQLQLYPTSSPGEGSPFPGLVLLSGLMITALSGAFSYAGITRNAVVMRTVEERTTELREAIERAARHQAELERVTELDRLKTNFVSAVSHDLRTPLTSIMGYSEFLEDEIGGPLSRQQKEYVQQILKGGRRLEYLVNDLLDFARLDAGTFKLTVSLADFRAKLQEVADSLRPQVEENRLSLEVHAPDRPLMATMDVQRIERVLINLLTNAIKFTPPDRHIRLSAFLKGEKLCCEVEDSGEGIAAEDLPKLFLRFSQLKSGGSKGGTGLGLSICKAIVEAHGGEIGVRSQLGAGSTFWFCLPLKGNALPEPPDDDHDLA